MDHRPKKKDNLLQMASVGNVTKVGQTGAPQVDVLSSVRKPPPLSAEELAASISRILVYGTVRESYHSREERATRNISDDDIQHGLQLTWKLSGDPDWDEKHRNWEYLIRTQDIEGDELHIKLVVDLEFDRVRIITKY